MGHLLTLKTLSLDVRNEYCSLVPGLSKLRYRVCGEANDVYRSTSLLLAIILHLLVPSPTSINVTSDHVNPIRQIGSVITLTCIVELSPAVDVPVTVTTVWTGPAQFMTTKIAQPVMGSTTTYISTAMVNSVGREQTGVYNCTATVSSMSPLLVDSDPQSGTIRVIIGMATR